MTAEEALDKIRTKMREVINLVKLNPYNKENIQKLGVITSGLGTIGIELMEFAYPKETQIPEELEAKVNQLLS